MWKQNPNGKYTPVIINMYVLTIMVILSCKHYKQIPATCIIPAKIIFQKMQGRGHCTRREGLTGKGGLDGSRKQNKVKESPVQAIPDAIPALLRIDGGWALDGGATSILPD